MSNKLQINNSTPAPLLRRGWVRLFLLLTLAAVLVMTGCKKDKDEEQTPPDVYAEFKADATPRWENGTTIEKSEESSYTFIIDTGNSLFASAKYKTGRTNSDGSSYEFIEFSGTPVAGKVSGASLRKPSGVSDLYSLEILKIESGKLWMVFK